MSANKMKWTEAGYLHFGLMGPDSLKVERLSLIVGLNRSSFYHYFGDLDIFTDHLCKYHIQRYQLIGEKLNGCKTFDPDLIQLIVKFKQEMAFHRQLLIHESVPHLKACFIASRKYTEKKVFHLWSDFKQFNEGSREFSLFNVVRDYFVLHFNQSNEEDVHKTLVHIQTLFHEIEQVDQ